MIKRHPHINEREKEFLYINDKLKIVKSCKIEYLMPAKLEDTLEIFSKIISRTRSSFLMEQIVKKNDLRCFLRWSVIQNTMFVSYSHYIIKEFFY